VSAQAWFVDHWGEPESLRLGDLSESGGGIPIRVAAAGINFFDLLQIRGQYQDKPPFPFVPGAEICGVREDTGERVIAFVRQGGYATRTYAAPSQIFPAPPELDDAQAAGFLVVYHTSWFVLVDRVKLQPGETLLVHAGASGTGAAAIEIGVALGARVWATASAPEKLDFCRSLGAERVIDYRDPAWIEQAKGVDVVYDPVGGDVTELSTKCMRPGGRLAIVGFAAGRIPTLAANRLLLKNISAVGAFWGGHLSANPNYLSDTQNALGRWIAQGKLRVPVKARYTFADAPRALRDVDGRRVTGKAVLIV
jgi:NADPH2:quinone reductase